MSFLCTFSQSIPCEQEISRGKADVKCSPHTFFFTPSAVGRANPSTWMDDYYLLFILVCWAEPLFEQVLRWWGLLLTPPPWNGFKFSLSSGNSSEIALEKQGWNLVPIALPRAGGLPWKACREAELACLLPPPLPTGSVGVSPSLTCAEQSGTCSTVLRGTGCWKSRGQPVWPVTLFPLFPGDIQWGETWATGSSWGWRMDQ